MAGFTKDAITINGGCKCQAFRYRVDVPPYDQRPENPYHSPRGKNADLRVPFTVIDHCNDCRKASGSILPMALVTEIATVSVRCLSRSANGPDDSPYAPATQVFHDLKVSDKGFYLSVYKSSPHVNRWFCCRCGTHLAYSADPRAYAKRFGGAAPLMLDIWLGTVDRMDLVQPWMKPERMLWCQYGIPWIRELARNGAGGIPESPLWKMDEVEEHS